MPVVDYPGDPDTINKNERGGGVPPGGTPGPGAGGSGTFGGGGSAFGTAPGGYGFTPNVGWRRIGQGNGYNTFNPVNRVSPYMQAPGAQGGLQKPGAAPMGTQASASGPDYSGHPADPHQDAGFMQMFGALLNNPAVAGNGQLLAKLYDQYLHSPAGMAAYSAGGGGPQGGANANGYGTFLNDTRQDIPGAMNRIFGGFGQAGFFDPGGSPYVMNAVRAQAQNNADALTRQATLGANVNGLDPGAAGAARLQALMGNQSNVANILGQAQYGQLQNQQQFAQNMAQNWFNNQLGAQQQQWMNNHQSQPNAGGQILGNFANAAGGALGGALTGFLGGPSAALRQNVQRVGQMGF